VRALKIPKQTIFMARRIENFDREGETENSYNENDSDQRHVCELSMLCKNRLAKFPMLLSSVFQISMAIF